MATTKKKPSAAQLAARAKFAAAAKAGTLRKNPANAKPTAKKKSLSEAVAQMRIWIRNDMEYPDAEWKAHKQFGYSAAKLREAYDDFYAKPKRAANPIKKTRSKSDSVARAHYTYPHSVEVDTPVGWTCLAGFYDLGLARQWAQAYSDMTKKQVRIYSK